MLKISEYPDVHILCEVRCPVCGNFKKPINTKLIEACYTGADGSLTGWAIITSCCQAILVKSRSFNGVLSLLTNSDGDTLHIKIVKTLVIPIEVIKIDEFVF